MNEEKPMSVMELHDATWPECTGFPQSCPENNGHGCCLGNDARVWLVEDDAMAAGPEGAA